jgi:hypothetical protein
VFRGAIPAGKGFGLIFDLSDSKDNPGPGNARAFFNHLLDAEDSTDEEYGEALEFLLDPANDNPARGRQIRGSTYRKPIRSNAKGRAGHPFVAMNWTHVPQTDEQIAERRKALGTKEKAA